ncbi:MAG: valine--tRNA ligase [Pseudanabaena sp. M135S2SP2A07QC]|nr:valine--tRNA ligase [Pseudanabaena sp. M090S1SP2A07QC]MCA6507180.1 valine--tRNA ligase [Pseudanabaena sp. M172S2SP2A07QC]MCA6520275.1 valine--tRNA ligase [Pseudanabaena sp. M051S1SP2A07QC]MCA6527478.1 valine--tRNA ligase [Pseudanabaena sp. M179S2SP2A07QC]MCA6530867.1 valine--tRNA ligase [Pseudanabaena sp. M125S2SP2A07QC]MCA6535626.1 valine--tRNA ligase [Pseudanabaena sp. M176S2SP2A07QC]MCA6538785.1 valine--tRNA ligase [Pseudanabaena sp. M037S2SP2A07QC]MCA6543392.1 valine--tRNA ligase [Pse
MSTTELPKQYNPLESEAKWQKYWEESGVFVAASQSDKEPYCIMIPPPNVTGSLHMGHAFQEVLIDILIRYHRMRGFNALWLPGTDHASIAVQTILDKQIKAEGKTNQEIGREQFLERAWKWKAESGGTIVSQLRRLGVSADWTRERFTMDEGLSNSVTEAFVKLYEAGLIYRGEYLVNWCPESQSAVSDLEVDSKEVNGHLWHFRYPLADRSGHLVVATTRPETMLGDTAVAVNPEDDRYKHLIGKTIMLPIMNREIPIIGDQYVDKAFGSGCVKITPAHDPNDFEMGKRHQLPLINILNKDGSINENGGEFQGQDRFVVRKNVVAKLDQLGLLEKIEDYTHTVPYSERGKVPVEPLLSIQWFVNIKSLSDFALEQFDKQNSPTFVPDRWGKVYRDWLIRLKDWCISRQLWWGHQIPAWYAPDGTIFVAHTEAKAYEQAKAKFGEDVTLERDPDVLDTWFSSGLWPFSTLGWPEQTQDFETFYPTSVLVTGFDIIFFWVARMTMMAGYFTGKMPFHTVYIHGLVRDENNQKMSKSKNNGIDPLVLINKYGTDALRYSLVKEVTGAGQDIRLDYNRKTDESTTVETARNFANKLWNASRFVMMNLNLERGGAMLQVENLELADRWILSRYYQTVLQVREQLDAYSMGEATKSLYEFFWGDFCDWYIELVKSRLQETAAPTSRATVQQTLAFVLNGILRLLHPFMPHVTEEIWQLLTYGISEPSSDRPVLAIQPYPEVDTTHINEELEEQFKLIIGTIRTIRNLRAEAEIKPSLKVKVILQSDSDRERSLLEAGQSYILDLARVEDLAILATVDESVTEEAIAGVVGTVQAIVSLVGVVDIAQLVAKLERSLKKLEVAIASSQGRLNNEGYVKKAPPDVVATASAELEESLKQQEILKARLAQLQK